MTTISPSHRALRLCIALAVLSSGLSLLLFTIPREMIAPQPPFNTLEGPAWQIVQGATLAISLVTMLIAALLPQAVVAPWSDPGARAGAHLATLAVALVALASIWFAARPELELAALQAYRTQIAVLSVASLIGIAGPLALIAALALRLPRRGPRLAALIGLAALMLADVALTAGFSPLPTGGLLLALLLLLAVALHRSGQLPQPTRAWLIALVALWALPWAVARLPLAGAALMIQAPSRRYSALADALLTPEPATTGPLPLLLCLGALATLLFAPQGRRANLACATLLALCALLPVLTYALGFTPAAPGVVFDMLRSGATSLGPALAMLLGWCANILTAPVMALVAAWFWLRGARVPL